MDPKSWKELKDKLVELGLTVKVVGKAKKEYVASNDKVTFDILRGGVTGTGSTIEFFAFDGPFSNIGTPIAYDNYRDSLTVLRKVESILNYHKEEI